MTTKLMGGNLGLKAVTLQTLDNFMDWLVSDEDKTEPQDLYAAVAWIFWATNLRANCIARVPYYIYPMEMEEDDEEPDNAVDFPFDLTATLWQMEMWTQLVGASYHHKRRNGAMLETLQCLNANTMKVHAWDQDGPTVFRQTVQGRTTDFPADDILYWHTFNPKDDIKAGVSAGKVSQTSGALIKHANEWASAFFANGAIPAVVLWSEGNIPDPEMERIKSVWQKLYSGVKNAFRTAVLRMGLKPEVIGQPIKDLAMPDLEDIQRRQILGAHLIPPGLAEPKTNRAEREGLMVELWTNTIIPELDVHLRPTLDDQLLNPLGLRISFGYNEIEVLQQMEIQKAEAMSFAISGVILAAYKENTVSVDEVRSWVDAVGQAANLPPLDASFTPEERTPLQLAPGGNGNGEDTGLGVPTPPEERIESRTSKAESADPFVSAPRWGHRTVSLQN